MSSALLRLPLVAAASAALLLCACNREPSAPPPVTGESRVDELLRQMSLDEKLALIEGQQEPMETFQFQAGYLAGIPRLKIPPLRFADGPHGVTTMQDSTGMPSTMSLAASFSVADAEKLGGIIGSDARALGQDIVLEPFINFARDPVWVRSYNTYGEDPLVVGATGAALVRGIQQQGVMAQAKHFIAYEGSGDVTVDGRTLREVYLAPFQMAIDAGVSSIMCSYNRVDGAQACGHKELLGILRDEMAFKGFVTSDWLAAQDTRYIEAGLDVNMPGEGTVGGAPNAGKATQAAFGFAPDVGFAPDDPRRAIFMPAHIRKAISESSVREESITRAAGRVLLQMQRFGLLDGKSKHDITPQAVEAHAPTMRQIAADGAVLLKNDDGALPLRDDDLQSLALIGPGAGQTIAIGEPGEKAAGYPQRQIGTLQALRELAPNAKITYATATDLAGEAIPAWLFSHQGEPGLQRVAEDGTPLQRDAQIDFTQASNSALPAGTRAHWDGTLTLPVPGVYWINLQVIGAGANVLLDGQPIAASDTFGGTNPRHGVTKPTGDNALLPTPDGLYNYRARLELAGGPHSLSITVAADRSNKPVQLRMAWVTPEQQKNNRDAAIAAAKKAKTAVVFAWSRGTLLAPLPEEQDALIDDIVAVNPNTIVVLNSGVGVPLPWLGKVKALLQMWYPGDEGGWATADLLLGRSSPAGRLPFTWPREFFPALAHDPKHPERATFTATAKTTYSEGVFVGHRWYEQQGIKPLFAFGYGLSYSRFDYSALKLRPAKDGGLDVSFTLRNSGSVDAEEVPQLYLGAPSKAPASVDFPAKTLAAYTRVHVPRGASVNVQLHVPKRQLQYWSEAQKTWATPAGERPVYIAAASDRLVLRGRLSNAP